MERSGDAVDLEEAFFAKENARLLNDLRKKAEKEEQRDLLRRVVSIKDNAFLDKLIMLGIGPETILTLRLIPLVFVAWADGNMDDREREAILKAAAQEDVAADEATQQLLRTWLEKKPDPQFLELWKKYIGSVWERFTPDEQWQMRQNLLKAARDVAAAAGGFLGIGSISAAERAVLNDLEKFAQ